MPLFTLDELADATEIVRSLMPSTPVYAWPLLARRAGAEVFVKHENHTPTGSFKARGGLVYVETLRREGCCPRGWSPPPAAITGNRWPLRQREPPFRR